MRVKAGHVLRVLRDVLHIEYARDLSHALMLRYIDKRQAEGARDTTIKKELRVFGGAWKLARRNQLVKQPLDELMPELGDDYPQLIGAAMGHSDSRMVERVYGRLPSDALAKLLSERVTRVERAAPAAASTPSASSAGAIASGEGASELVRYLSGRPGQTGRSEDSADKMTAAPTSENPSQIEVRRGGIEPPTRGFSVRPESPFLRLISANTRVSLQPSCKKALGAPIGG